MSETQKLLSDGAVRFKAFRLQRGETQDEMAGYLSGRLERRISRSLVSAIENGSRKPSDDLVELLFLEPTASIEWLAWRRFASSKEAA